MWVLALVKFLVLSVLAKNPMKKNTCQHCVSCSHNIIIDEHTESLFNEIHQTILDRLFSLHQDIPPQDIPPESNVSVITGVLRQYFPELFGNIEN